MMGLSERMYFWSWRLICYATALVSIIVMSIGLKTLVSFEWDPGNQLQYKKRKVIDNLDFFCSSFDYVLCKTCGKHE